VLTVNKRIIRKKAVISLNITLTEEAKRYIAQASEEISKSKEKPALAIWAERIYA